MDNALAIWTVYDRPADFPNTFIARKYVIHDGGTSATEDVVVNPHLDSIRQVMRQMGLTCIQRNPEDDPKIVECWI